MHIICSAVVLSQNHASKCILNHIPVQLFFLIFVRSDLIETNGMIEVGSGGTSTCNDTDAKPSQGNRKRRAAAEERVADNGALQASTSYTAFTRASILTGNEQVSNHNTHILNAHIGNSGKLLSHR